jgi:hypothetical protein
VDANDRHEHVDHVECPGREVLRARQGSLGRGRGTRAVAVRGPKTYGLEPRLAGGAREHLVDHHLHPGTAAEGIAVAVMHPQLGEVVGGARRVDVVDRPSAAQLQEALPGQLEEAPGPRILGQAGGTAVLDAGRRRDRRALQTAVVGPGGLWRERGGSERRQQQAGQRLGSDAAAARGRGHGWPLPEVVARGRAPHDGQDRVRLFHADVAPARRAVA